MQGLISDALQHKWGDKFRNGNVHVEVSCFVKSNWKLFPLKIHHTKSEVVRQ